MKRGINEGVSIGFFGTFFPQSSFVGTASTGIVRGLALNERVETLLVFSQAGSYLPKGIESSKVEVIPCWTHDDPFSLLHALRIMRRRARKLDGFLFNVLPTAFGQSSFANAVGLLVPFLLALSTRKPVVVYLHNLLETQDVIRLGYRPTISQRMGVRFLEWLLLCCTTVVVPLKSQQEKVAEVFRVVTRRVPLPFVEPFGLLAASGRAPGNDAIPPEEPTRILLLGKWGPQKDLMGVLRALRSAHERGGQFVVTITGAINPQFPEYETELDRAVASLDPEWFRLLKHVPEAELLDTVLRHDLLILPYNASGGYSGAMSVGAYCGIGIIAYDLPQLREAADELEIHPSFVMKDDPDAIANEILSFSANVWRFREFRSPVPRPDYDARACEAVGRLVKILSSANQE